MCIRHISDFIRTYIDSISESLTTMHPEYRLTGVQKYWLGFCLTGLLLSNSVNWSAYSRLSLGRYSLGALSWMFRRSSIAFEYLLKRSIFAVLSLYKQESGHIIFDDTDNERSKNAVSIHGLGKQKDKKSGGYFQGQNILYMVLVTAKVTIPIGFKFYENDPEWIKWKKEADRLAKKKVTKAHRPKELVRDMAKYPTKLSLSVQLAADFKAYFPDFVVLSIQGDCFYGTQDWTSGMAKIYPKAQILSQLKSNQIIKYQNKELSLNTYFSQRAAIESKTVIRGGKSVVIYYSSVVAYVKAHKAKRLIIAYKYQGETEYRYVFATNMSWTPHHVMATYSLRWLVEVFIADWKQYEGWAVLTKHIGFEGSERSLILSLLFDHCLILHPEQQARIKNNLPAATVGSLREKAIQVHIFQSIKDIIEAPDVKEQLILFAHNIENIYCLRDSSKHLAARKFEFS